MRETKNTDLMLDRLPPQALDAEQSVLGAVLLDNEALREAQEILDKDDFYRDSHRKIFSAMLKLHEENTAVDFTTITNKLKNLNELEDIGGCTYLSSISQCTPTAANVRYHARIVKEKSVLRSLLRMCTEISAKVYEDGGEPEVILHQSQELLSEIIEKSGFGKEMGVLALSEEELLDYISFSRELPFPKLNDLIGCLSAKSLTIVGGRAGMGKTSFTSTVIRKVAFEDSEPVAYFGASNHKHDEFKLRLISAMASVDIRKLKGRGKLILEEMGRVKKANERLNKSESIHAHFDTKMKAHSIFSMVRALEKKLGRKPALIVIENLQDLAWVEECRNDTEKMNKILPVLRHFVNTYKVPTIASSHLNRDSEDREDCRPTMADCKNTGKIEEYADIVFLLHRPQYHDKSADGLPEEGEIIIAKGGPPTIVTEKFYGNFLRWGDS